VTHEEFEGDFHSRTLAYLGAFAADSRAVVVVIGADAHNEPGHALVSGLANLLARAHRRLVFVGDLERPLLHHDPLGATTLHDATIGRALAINPFIDIEHPDQIPTDDVLISIGIGCDADLRVGAHQWCALFGEDASVDASRTSLLGAALASGLTAAVAFHRQLGRPGRPEGSYSLWEAGRQSAVQGPMFEQSIDVGRVLQAGAGAVACALDYWVAVIGNAGSWTIADGDTVDVTNLNRQMLFTAADAGFPEGEARNKADAAAAALSSAVPHPCWVDQVPGIAEALFDLVLPLANEYGARVFLQSRVEPVLLHATTTPNWAATTHRHIAGRDGCIVCRLPNDDDATFTCSTATVDAGEKRADASLPFLSATAGVLLLAEIARLQLGQLRDPPTNYAVLDFQSPTPVATAYAWPGCRDGCRVMVPAAARVALNRSTRWGHLDDAA
jgi:ThiF family